MLARAYRAYHSTIKGSYSREIQLLLVALGACFACTIATIALPFGTLQFVAGAVLATCASVVLAGLLITRIGARVADVQDALAFSLLHSPHSPVNDLLMSGAAANPSLQLLLQKVLRLFQPKRILELGSGQTTKILARYCAENEDVRVMTLEESAPWREMLSRQLSPCRNHEYRWVPVEARQFASSGREISTYWYAVDPRPFAANGFDFILVDGPDGPDPHARHARAGILEWLPDVLAERFVVVFDDAERYGEVSTVAAFDAALHAHRRKAISFSTHGVKTQVVFCSPEWAFLRSV